MLNLKQRLLNKFLFVPKLNLKLLFNKLHIIFFYLLVLFFPSQLGYHFWPSWSFLNGLRIDYLSPVIYFTDILLLLVLFFWFFSLIYNNSLSGVFIYKYLFSSQKKIVVVIIFVCFSFFYLNPYVHLLKIIKLVEFYFLYLYFKKNYKIFNLKIIAFSLSAGLILETFLLVMQFVLQSSVGSFFYFLGERNFNSSTPGIAQVVLNGRLSLRPYGTFSHPNSLAGYFLLGIFIIEYLFSQTFKKPTKVISHFKYTVFFLSAIGIFLSFSRSVWVVGFFLILLLVVLLNKKNRVFIIILQNKTLFLGSLVILFVFSLFLFPVIKNRMTSLSTTDSLSLVRRNELNDLALKMFYKKPLIGVGLNNYLISLPLFVEKEARVRFYQPVHNIYLLILAETGLVGLSLFLIFLFTFAKIIFWQLLKQKDHSFLYLLFAFVAVFFLAFLDHYWFTLQQNMLLFVFLIVCFSKHNRLKKQNSRILGLLIA